MNAPGCFGSPTAITPGVMECESCPASKECLVKARECLAQIEDELDAGRLIGLWRKLSVSQTDLQNSPKLLSPSITPGVTVRRAGLPKKALKLVERLTETGINHREILKTGANPFAGIKPAFLTVVGSELLAGGFTKRGLKAAFMTELSWGEKTAASHVSLSVPALNDMGIISERDGVFIIRETINEGAVA